MKTWLLECSKEYFEKEHDSSALMDMTRSIELAAVVAGVVQDDQVHKGGIWPVRKKVKKTTKSLSDVSNMFGTIMHDRRGVTWVQLSEWIM